MKADWEFEPKELAKRGAKFCHNPREAVSEWGVIKVGIEDELRSLRAGSHSIFEMHMSRMRLAHFLESFRHSLTKRPEIFDAESLKVLSELERLTLEWVRREAKTKGNRFVDTPCEIWMGAWQDFCNAYESFSRKVEFELAFEKPNKSRQDKHGDIGKGRKLSLNAHMTNLMEKHKESCQSWTVERWQLELTPTWERTPSKGGIHATAIWKWLMSLREETQNTLQEKQTAKDIYNKRRSTRY